MAFRTTTVSPLLPSARVSSGLHFVGKCYAPEKPAPDGPTLVFFHCAGSHKETFEPILAPLFALRKDGAPVVREAWSFDMQSHGEASGWNARVLGDAGLSVEDWAEGFKEFVKTGVFDGHKLVGVGHSLGATMLLLTTMPSALPPVQYHALVVIEPALITQAAWDANAEERVMALKMMSKAVMKRRDAWASRTDARAYFEQRLPWAIWDKRVLELFLTHGLREVAAEGGAQETRLCCSKTQENTTYTHIKPHFDVLDGGIARLPDAVPLHFVLGGRDDLVPKYCHQSVIDIRPIASLQLVPNGGHFCVQETPAGVADAIGNILVERVPAGPKSAL